MQNPPNIFARLANHGISTEEYGTIKRIVSFSLPQTILLFARQYGDRSVTQVFRLINEWKSLLRKDLVLSQVQRSELERTVLGAELLVWNVLLEANLPQVGPWTLRMGYVPTGEDETGQPLYHYPSLKITANHRETQEVRETIIPGGEQNVASFTADAYREAFGELGIYDLIDKGFPARGLVSARKPQGWPIFTQVVIPNLYEFLLPYYRKRGHHSATREQTHELERPALYPKELLEDMVDILKVEHRSWFANYTVRQLKAVIQRHLDKKASSTKSDAPSSHR